jgi:phosphopantothenate-cysteine ligase
MKILITSGGTKEHIDEVRVLTNISTGKLGATIADSFMKEIVTNKLDDKIYYVYVKGSEMPKMLNHKIEFFEVTDVKSVYDIMEKLVPEMNVVIHPMSVSDFGFKPTDKKLKSNDSEAFIESLRERIYQTPKILSKVKEWNPKCFLISFKFENGLSNEELMNIAYDSLVKNGSDIVIANDKAEMKKLNTHRAYFVSKHNDSRVIHTIEGKEEIAKEILRLTR